MYLRALDNTSSRCSPTVSLVMRGTPANASLTFSSVVLAWRLSGSLFKPLPASRPAPLMGRIDLASFGFFGFFMNLIGDRRTGASRIGRSGIYSFVAQNTKELFLDFRRMVHIVNYQIPHICLHLYCTKSEQCFLQARDLIIHGLDLRQA